MEENENVKEAVENMEKLKNDEHEQYLAWLREKYTLDMNTAKKVGRKEEKRETVKRMLEANISIEIIVKATEVSEEEIEKIQLEMNK